MAKSEKGITFKRPEGKRCVCISDWEPFLVEQCDLMNSEKYFVTPVGSTLTSLESKKQSKMLKRQRQRNEVQNQKAAKIIAEKQREEWIKRTYDNMINSAIRGNPWL